MNSFRVALIFCCVLVTGAWCDSSKVKSNIDLEDYIDSASSNPKPIKEKGEDLGTSETGYYNYAPHLYQGHAVGHQHHAHPVYHAHHVAPYSHGHHYSHGYGHVPYDAGHGHAHSYYDSGYADVLGHAHVGSAHVSYGTNINHGYGLVHNHHHHGAYH